MANKETTALARRAQAQGWDVRLTKNGHLAYRSPGGKLIHTGSTPGDASGQRDHLVRMRRAGFQDNPPKQDPHRETRMAKAVTQQAAVLAALQEFAGQVVDIATVAKKARLEPKKVGMALYWLKQNHPEVRPVDRGRYIYQPAGDQLPLAEQVGPEVEPEAFPEPALPVPAPEPSLVGETHLNGNSAHTNGHGPAVESLAEAAAAVTTLVETERPAIKVMPSALPKDLPAMFEAVSTDGKGRLVLRDENGDHWLAVAMKPVL